MLFDIVCISLNNIIFFLLLRLALKWKSYLFSFCILYSILILRADSCIILKWVLLNNLICVETSPRCDHVNRRGFLLFNWYPEINIQSSLKQRLLIMSLIVYVYFFIILVNVNHAICVFFFWLKNLIRLVYMMAAHIDRAKLKWLFWIY